LGSRRSGDHGVATVEFALLLPVLLLILFGIIEFGRGFNMQLSMSHGAREGVRVLALGGSTADAVTRTEQAAFPVTGLTVTTVGCPAVVSLTTPPARVTVTRTYDPITPLAAIMDMVGGGGAATPPTIEARGEMRCSG
jgi:Flp pilus assembly protein TadG